MSCVCNHSDRPFPASTPRDAPARCRLRSRAQRCLRATRGCAPPTRVVHIFCWQACGHPEAIQLKPLIYRRFFRRITKASGPCDAPSAACCPQFLLASLWISCACAPQGIDPARFTAARQGNGQPGGRLPVSEASARRRREGGRRAGGTAGRLPACGSASPGREPASAIGSDYRSGWRDRGKVIHSFCWQTCGYRRTGIAKPLIGREFFSILSERPRVRHEMGRTEAAQAGAGATTATTARPGAPTRGCRRRRLNAARASPSARWPWRAAPHSPNAHARAGPGRRSARRASRSG